jgi:hypothetical protein
MTFVTSQVAVVPAVSNGNVLSKTLKGSLRISYDLRRTQEKKATKNVGT